MFAVGRTGRAVESGQSITLLRQMKWAIADYRKSDQEAHERP